jgi:tetratricopeptide (TPR) repeat protein
LPEGQRDSKIDPKGKTLSASLAQQNFSVREERRREMGVLGYLSFVVLLFTSPGSAKNLKDLALEKSRGGNYEGAISILEEALKESPKDPEIYYYLGRFTHYFCYDSRPLSGFDISWSDKILRYLRKAVSLKPDYGDALYFIGAEHGARFWMAMREGNTEKMKRELIEGREEGGYPDWLLEYGENLLRSCERDAILLVAGDAETNAAIYLQLVKKFRTDVTVIPFALLERPWYVLLLKRGIEGVLRSCPISWTEEQILDMHPYKWKGRKISIAVSGEILQKLGLEGEDSVFLWDVEPDLESQSKSFLSPGKALLLDIVESNGWKRPIYLSLSCAHSIDLGLDDYLQLCGLAYRFLPVNVEEHNLTLNEGSIENVLMNPKNLENLSDLKKHNMPRISGMLNYYRYVLLTLAKAYYEKGEKERARGVIERMEELIPEDVLPISPGMTRFIEKIKSLR